MSDYRLTRADWLRLRWWGFRAWLRRCPDCRRRGWDPITPRWDEDPVVRLCGFRTAGRCGACGKDQP